MAIDTYLNVSKQGGKTAGGKQATIPSRAAAAGGAVTLAFDSAVVTTMNELLLLAREAALQSGLK